MAYFVSIIISGCDTHTHVIVGVILVQKLCFLSLFACDTVPGTYIKQIELHFLQSITFQIL